MIYRKNDRQIEKEKSEQRYYAKLVKGYPSPVCEYFVVHQTKGNVDVWNLTTEEIVEYILSTKNMDILKYCKQEQMINDYSKDIYNQFIISYFNKSSSKKPPRHLLWGCFLFI